MSVDLGGTGALVAEEFLDDPEVGAVFQQVRREAVTKGMGCYVLLDSRGRGGVLHHSLDGPCGQVATGTVTGEEPSVGRIGVPVVSHRLDGPASEEGVAVPASLAPGIFSPNLGSLRTDSHNNLMALTTWFW